MQLTPHRVDSVGIYKGKEMNINYPSSINTDMKKIRFIFRVIEIFRQGHNFMGYWWKTGFTSETQWNNALNNQIPVPAANWIRNHYIYHSIFYVVILYKKDQLRL